ncbi:MAG: CsgG/HfaB family protein [Thermodesulfobacteriota bacterium]|nr:CsgG/HfaB family protein [Thermodesulfobacteriota bacterium]
MKRWNTKVKKLWILLALPTFFLVTHCAEVQLNTIPPPPPGAKLRIFIQPTSSTAPKRGWRTPYKKFEKKMYQALRKTLSDQGMYEVVPKKDVRSVLGRQISTVWRWERNDWSLAKEVGRSVYAEYAMIAERGWEPSPYWRVVLINIETGKQFAVFSHVKVGTRGAYSPVIKASYREIFRDAKKDLMVTALRIGNRKKDPHLEHKSPPLKKVPASIQRVEKPPVPSKKPRTLASLGRQVDIAKTLEEKSAAKGRAQLAVYDLDAAKHLKIVALILSEALREELFRLGNFILVNRENMNQVVQEVTLGQTGLIDEKQAVQAGKALAAKQIIVGSLRSIGKSSLLQAKRINTETHSTMAISSLRCKNGKEEVLLDHMEKLASKLVQTQ